MVNYTTLIMGRLPAVLLIVAVFLLSGCLPETTRPPLPKMVWPDPPETPRITLLNTVRTSGDLGIRAGIFTRLWRSVAGTPEPEIQSPHGVTTDHAGRMYVVDKVMKCVHVFDRAGQRYLSMPSTGAPLLTPIDVAVDEGHGRVFVSDAAAAAVRIFTLDGEPAGEIKRGSLGRPTGLAINTATDELLIVDTEHASLLRFDLDKLQQRAVIGHLGVKAGQFNSPTAVAVSPSGMIYVVDSLNHRVQILSASGASVGSFGEACDGPGCFSRPKAAAVDSQGNVHVLDALFDNVQVFDPRGQLLIAYGGPGYGPGRFWLPSGISIDSSDRIYVSDTYNQRIQVFQFLKGGKLLP